MNHLVYYSGLFTSGDIGATVFALITGWFIADSHYSVTKWLKYAGETLFYSYFCIIIASLIKLDTVDFKNVVYSLFPISSSLNWYASTFCVAYLFLPAIKTWCIFLRKDEGHYSAFILIGLFAFFIIGTLTPVNHVVSTFSWMVYVFVLGDYLRWRNDNNTGKMMMFLKKYSGRTLLVLFTFLCAVRFAIDKLSAVNQMVQFVSPSLTGRYSVFTVLTAICCLVFFPKLNFSSGFINWFGKNVFGTYLLHDNYILYPLTWFLLLKTDLYIHSRYQFLHFFVCIIAILTICAVIDSCRRITFEKIWIKCVRWIDSKLLHHQWHEMIENYFKMNESEEEKLLS